MTPNNLSNSDITLLVDMSHILKVCNLTPAKNVRFQIRSRLNYMLPILVDSRFSLFIFIIIRYNSTCYENVHIRSRANFRYLTSQLFLFDSKNVSKK